ncbi:hypothetical protein GCM10017783_09840 [Deinococcus piscis]|uniref:Phosphatidylserine decarboxylase n=1 Tax=Deinococcus piscis TaxID=394230 RepID=A0ABQ3K4J3_9DEIO|nr:phosphatidylserine decarboxylase [Deinococcus piscis]GHF99761.1 hypothetical protein GCM10017783_09840 [Deinococcus piscis]
MKSKHLLAGLSAAALAWAYHQRSYRYRDPVRLPPAGAGLLSPADGRVAFVRRTEDGWQLGVALDSLSVRYVYAPQDGTVQALTREDAHLPEQTRPADGLTLTFGNDLGVTLTAPTGRLQARTYFSAGQPVRQGNKLAFLERGERVVLSFGAGFRPVARVGERVTGAQTVVAQRFADIRTG